MIWDYLIQKAGQCIDLAMDFTHPPHILRFMPQVFNIPKVEHDQPCSTLVVLFFKISLFIYVILGADWSIAKNNINKQTNFEKQNNQSWAWLIMLNFGNVKNLGHKYSGQHLWEYDGSRKSLQTFLQIILGFFYGMWL